MQAASSWRTTVGGVVALLGALISIGKGATAQPINFELIMIGVTAIPIAIGLIFAKDKGVSNATSVGPTVAVPPDKL